MTRVIKFLILAMLFSAASAQAAPDRENPVVNITFPAAGATITGLLTVVASASDDKGVASVQFKLDGNDLGALDTSSPYSVLWDTRTVANGSHTLSAVALDTSGKPGTAQGVTVTVNNPVPDTTAPSVPQSLSIQSSTPSSIELTWTPSTDNIAVAGYRLYRNGSYLRTVSAPPAADGGLAAETTYTYAVSAIDAANNESLKSSSVSHSTPVTFVLGNKVSLKSAVYSYDYNGAEFVVIPKGSTGTLVGQIEVSGLQAYMVFFDGNGDYNTVCQSYEICTGVYENQPATYPGFEDSYPVVLASYLTTVITDVQSPSQPYNLSLAVNGFTTQNIKWGLSTDNIGVVGYDVARNGVPLQTTTSLGYASSGLLPNTTYYYSVTAKDAAGNRSQAAELLIKTLADVTSPSQPQNLQALAVSGTQINLSWSASTDNIGVAGYKIYQNNSYIITTAALNHTVTGLTPGVLYTFGVSAFDAANNESPAAQKSTATPDSVAPSVALTTPANNATVQGVVTITADAHDNVGVAGVQFKINGINHNPEVAASPYSTTWNTTSLTNGASYTITAVARDAAGNSVTSAGVTVTVNNPDILSPSTPANLQGTAASSTQINLTWNAATDNVAVTGYRIYRAISPNTPTFLRTVSTNSASETGLAAGTTYSYRVSAIDAANNESGLSTTLNVATNQNPTANAGSNQTTTVNTQITLSGSGTDSDGTITGYSWSFGDGTAPGTSATVTHTYTVAGTYTATLTVTDNKGGTGSASITITVNADAVQPNVSISAPANGATVQGVVTITASASDNVGVAGVQFKLNGINHNPELTAPPYSTTWNTTSLANGASYTITAVARDLAGNSRTSAGVSVTTNNPDTISPSTPTGLQGSAASSTQINLTWSAATDNVAVTGYRIYRAISPNTPTYLRAVSANSASETGLAPGTTYTYRVSAIDAANNESALSTAANVPTLANQNPTANAGSNQTTTVNTQITLSGSGTDGDGTITGYSWNFGDGTALGTSATVTHTYTAAGTYTATLTVTDNQGGTGSASVTITVNAAGGDNIIPSTPAGFRISGWYTCCGAIGVSFSWTASTDNVGVTGYKIYRQDPGQGSATYRQTVPVPYYDDLTLQPLSTYTYQVSAVDAAGNESLKGSYTITAPDGDLAAPTTPTNLRATFPNSSSVTLTWNASTDNRGVGSYYIYRQEPGQASPVFRAWDDAPTVTWTDTALAPYVSYTYLVSAVDHYLNESPKASVTNIISTPTVGVRPAPGPLNAALVVPGEITLTVPPYTGPAPAPYIVILISTTSAAGPYALERREGAPGLYTFVTSTVSPVVGQTYYFKTFYDFGNEVSASTAANVITVPNTPYPPTGLIVKRTYPSEVDLSWSAPANTPLYHRMGFSIERSQAGGPYSPIAIVGPDVYEYADRNLAFSTQYAYRVKAYNYTGASAFNGPVSTTTAAAPNIADTPGNLLFIVTNQGTTLLPTRYNLFCDSLNAASAISVIPQWFKAEANKYGRPRPFSSASCASAQVTIPSALLLPGNTSTPIDQLAVANYLQTNAAVPADIRNAVSSAKYVNVIHYLGAQQPFQPNNLNAKFSFVYLFDYYATFSPDLDGLILNMAHEMTHALGASDKYLNNPAQACTINPATGLQYSPFDVMCHRLRDYVPVGAEPGFKFPPLQKLIVSPGSATETGWSGAGD